MIDLAQLSLFDPASNMEGSKIKRKDGEVARPIANEFQREVSDVIRYCHDTRRPCRIIILKPRQKGSSTISVAAGHARLKAKSHTAGLIAGGAHFQGKNLFNILGTYTDHDELHPGCAKVKEKEVDYWNGSKMERITLANQNAGRSGTYQFMLVTEVAYLAEEGVSAADEVLNGLLKCVGYQPDTIIILESTAKGANGDYYDRYQDAITFEEFKSGKNGYVKVFYPWYAFEDSRMSPESEGLRTEGDRTQQEVDLAEKWGLDLSQIAWMRWALREECKGDWDRFCQDYPFDEETAFLKSGRQRFSAEGLKWQGELAKRQTREFGSLELDRLGRVLFRGSSEQEARCVRYERPKVGCKYVLSVDSMTGESQTSGDDPDSHGIHVLRAGYMDARRGGWVEPAVVMRQILYPDGVRFGCWWDIDVLEEEVYRMSMYWGGCLIVPEMNMDRGLVELLKLRPDANIYEREMFNRREGVRTKALGWVTDKVTRGMIIENLARMIREAGKGSPGEGLEIRDPWTIRECRNFVVKPSGRAEAAQGHHDDQVLSLAIGAYLLDHGTPFFEEERPEWLPPDLRKAEVARSRGVGRAQFM